MPAEPATIRMLLAQAVELLATESPRLDAELLLAGSLGKSRSYLYTWPEAIPPADIQARFHDLLARRATGEPVAYLLGQREFWSLPLSVTPATLIPRPETEILVTLALQRIPVDANTCIADLGTGSGAIALAIARERPRCRIIATDISQDALAVAAVNAARLGLSNVKFIAGDWCAALPDMPFDLIVSNPPYIPEDDIHLTRGDVRFEPRHALASGPQGMDALQHIARCASTRLRPHGWLLLEHGYDQAQPATRLLRACGYEQVHDYPDDAGLGRVITGRRPGTTGCPEVETRD
jgi:release factor glutamine methyltransferase